MCTRNLLHRALDRVEPTISTWGHVFASMAAHRGIDKRLLSDVMGYAHVGVTDRVYEHLYDRQSAENNFRAAKGARRATSRGVTPTGPQNAEGSNRAASRGLLQP